jgi:hypothetical protein
MRPKKITFGETRDMGVRGILVYCHCSHSVALNSAQWPDDVRLSDIEPRFTCTACGKRGADVRPDFNWNAPARPAMGIETRHDQGVGATFRRSDQGRWASW